MILITSGDYIVDELRIEFGKIPPAFLPIGNTRLYIHQIESLKLFEKEEIFLTLPESYEIKVNDLTLLKSLSVQIIKIPDKLSLGKSIYHALTTIDKGDEKLLILHGDTLIKDIPNETDFILVGEESEDYNWEYDQIFEQKKVWCGLFSFSKCSVFKKNLQNSNYDFTNSVKKYSNEFKLNRIVANDWSDFGHVVTFYKNRCKITTQRSFNYMQISDGIVTKSSQNEKKIIAEIDWFLNLPTNLKIYTPNLITHEKDKSIKYSLEYLYLPTLSELYVFGEQGIGFWKNVFSNCFLFLKTCKENKNTYNNSKSELNSKSLIVDKTLSRLSELKDSGIWEINSPIYLNNTLHPSLLDIANKLFIIAIDGEESCGYLHGDFCFSNILYDIRSNRIKVIDPRGIDNNNVITQFGDIYYDYAKISHSIIGCYDFIIAKMYNIKKNSNNNFSFSISIDERLTQIQNEFINNLNFEGVNFKKIYSQMILLFISMVPLHKDNEERQIALILNAYRLYNIFINL